MGHCIMLFMDHVAHVETGAASKRESYKKDLDYRGQSSISLQLFVCSCLVGMVMHRAALSAHGNTDF